MSGGLFSPLAVASEAGIGTEAAENWLLSMAGPKDRVGRMFTDLGRKKFLETRGRDAAQNGGGATADLAQAGRKDAEGTPEPHREDLKITRANLSPRVVLAERANGNEVQCLVRSTALLKPGMVLRGCVADQFGWTYMGKLPRVVGEQQLFYANA